HSRAGEVMETGLSFRERRTDSGTAFSPGPGLVNRGSANHGRRCGLFGSDMGLSSRRVRASGGTSVSTSSKNPAPQLASAGSQNYAVRIASLLSPLTAAEPKASPPTHRRRIQPPQGSHRDGY